MEDFGRETAMPFTLPLISGVMVTVSSPDFFAALIASLKSL